MLTCNAHIHAQAGLHAMHIGTAQVLHPAGYDSQPTFPDSVSLLQLQVCMGEAYYLPVT